MCLIVTILGWKNLFKMPILGMPCERLANMIHQMKKSLLDCMKCLWNIPMLIFRYALHGQLSLEKGHKKWTKACIDVRLQPRKLSMPMEMKWYYIFFKIWFIMLFHSDLKLWLETKRACVFNITPFIIFILLKKKLWLLSFIMSVDDFHWKLQFILSYRKERIFQMLVHMLQIPFSSYNVLPSLPNLGI